MDKLCDCSSFLISYALQASFVTQEVLWFELLGHLTYLMKYTILYWSPGYVYAIMELNVGLPSVHQWPQSVKS
jgi:hypothetical protein